MEQQIYSDGIGRISIIGGMVRLDLMTYSATETDAAGQARPVLTQRVVMGTEAFLQSSEKILEAVKLLTQSIRAKTPAPQPAAPAAAPQPPVPQAMASQTVAPPPPPRVERQEQISQPVRAMPSPWSEPLVPKLPFP